MRHGVLLGAGFSCWAAGLPVASGLFDFAIAPLGIREARRLARVEARKSAWDLANPEGEAERFIAEMLEGGARARQDVLWYVARRLSEPFIWTEFHAQGWRRHVFMIDEHRAPRPGADLLRRVAASRCCGIVTTNYDMIAEYALTTRGFNYGSVGERLVGRGPYPVSQWRNPVTLRGRLPLAKIHGSISWDEVARYTDGRRGLTGNALIVAPTQAKQPPSGLGPVWRLADSILAGARRLLVFGFAFNPYDSAVLDLLRAAGQGLDDVLLVDVAPPVGRARSLWPRARVCAVGPEVLPTALADWLAAREVA